MQKTHVENLIEKLTLELKDKHECHTIILYGSYADDTYNENSDIDIICIKKDGEHYKDARLWNDIFLDVWIYPEDQLKDIDNFFRIANGKALLQKDKFGDEFIDKVKTVVSGPVEAFSANELNFFYTWSKKMVRRAKVNDVEGNYRKFWLLNDLLCVYYFSVRQIRSSGIKKDLIYLKKHDNETYQLFNYIYLNPFDFNKIEILIEKVFYNKDPNAR